MFDRRIKGIPIIAVLRGITPEEAIPVGEMLSGAGIVVMEVTLNSPKPYESIQQLSQHFGAERLVGAGTVTSPDQVLRVKQAGGRLVVSPHTDVEIIRVAKAENMVVVPGCFSPTEILMALRAGADAIKLFPANMMPPAAVKALRAVFPRPIELFTTGGIDANNMAEYLKSGADGFGIGSSLYKPGKPLSEIEKDITSLVMALQRAQDNLKITKQ